MSARKPRRRRNGEGNIYQRPSGRWQGSLTVGTDGKGRQLRKYVSGATEQEVIAKLATLRLQHYNGTLPAEEMPLEALLLRWLDQKEGEVKPRTLESYTYHAHKHLIPFLGRNRLTRLSPLQLQAHFARIGKDHGPRTSNLARAVLNMALKQAVGWGLLIRNPLDGVAPIRIQERELKLWTPAQMEIFLRVASEHRYYALFYLAISTGLRSGELLGLQWPDISGTKLTVRRSVSTRSGGPVYSTPKTRSGQRAVSLGEDTLSVLSAHRKRQAELRAEKGARWEETGHVFTAQNGKVLYASNIAKISHRLQREARNRYRRYLKRTMEGEALRQELERLRNEESFPRLRFHDFRHLNVSIRRRLGQDAKVIADQVGHTDPSFTLRRYTHLFEDDREAAVVDLREHLRN